MCTEVILLKKMPFLDLKQKVNALQFYGVKILASLKHVLHKLLGTIKVLYLLHLLGIEKLGRLFAEPCFILCFLAVQERICPKYYSQYYSAHFMF